MSLKSYLEEAEAEKKLPVIAVVGPTASGKSGLAVELGRVFGGEIVSADSMQIYKQISIATAKPTEKEMRGIKHHLIDFWDIDRGFNVYLYCALAKDAIKDIHSRGVLPILVGGTGLYIDSLLKGLEFTKNDTDSELRKSLEDKLSEYGNKTLYRQLSDIDPEFAEKIKPTDSVRIIRALERYLTTGKTPSQLNIESKKKESVFKPIYIGLNFRDRSLLYERINDRVDKMAEKGIFDEAAALLEKKGDSTGGQAIGLKELVPFLKGEATKEECIENLKQSTRRYAKRQLTWFKRNKEINWFYPDDLGDESELFGEVTAFLNNYGNGAD